MKALEIVALALVICATPVLAQNRRDPDFYPSAHWSVAPSSAPMEAEVEKSGSVGALLFQQNLRAAAVAILPGETTLTVPAQTRWGKSPADVRLEPGSVLPKLTNIGGSDIFCAQTISWKSPNVLDGRRLRACMYDRERDGVFDLIFWMGVTDLNSSMFIFRDGRAEGRISVPYIRETAAGTPVMVAGPLVTRSALGAYRVTVGLRDNGASVPLVGDEPANARARVGEPVQNAMSVYFRATDVPLTITLGGARLEIKAVEGNRLTYTVLSYFDPALPFAIAYNRELPVRP